MIYATIPDYALQLTLFGKDQSMAAGEKIRALIGSTDPVQYYVSPFWRTRQTFLGIRYMVASCKDNYYEDPRLREQEWNQKLGSREGYKDNEECERDHYGHFYYRFNGGESCADVFDRVSDFMNTMFRDFQKKEFPRNVIIVTHGMTMRLFLMRFFHSPVEEFETWGNPNNGEFYHLERRDKEKYELLTPLKTHQLRHSFQFNWDINSSYSPVYHKLPYETKKS